MPQKPLCLLGCLLYFPRSPRPHSSAHKGCSFLASQMCAKFHEFTGPSLEFWLVLPACLHLSLSYFFLRGWQGGRRPHLLSQASSRS